ncbi:hypothetical protein [Bradyrhizobium sp. CCBAU 51765]|nr:hypothetical protein [Bradyrhizobium sp. CCBAU 51765]
MREPTKIGGTSLCKLGYRQLGGEDSAPRDELQASSAEELTANHML